ncbi:actin-related protein 2/3 complex subunit 2B-like [Dorcoceras hygrometricum]|uniref:Arp2/3 complex 34 kDa subunit n=1 Tax=Dorcoceras hygrometricum TaxID=472368 RepID=A0A2Z7D8Y2_9LAMI|nr:actin-related protein 2/3 complex subunit 2B-like [Dorcoceras hygrometricum]
MDHQIHEYGDARYHIQSSVMDPFNMYLSISTPFLELSPELSKNTLEMVKGICPTVVEIIEPPREGYQLTLKLNLSRFPKSKAAVGMITEISSVQAVILISQLKDLLRNADLHEGSRGTCRPIKLIYHPRDPFFVIKGLEVITTIFPMRFKEETDVIIAKSFFQELMDAANLGVCTKAPRCVWSPIPPPELRGESIEDLSTNVGFVSLEITSRHLEGQKLDRAVWNLLNFHAFVNYHVKSTRSFIQRRMRTRLESLVQVLVTCTRFNRRKTALGLLQGISICMLQRLHDVEIEADQQIKTKKAKSNELG